MCRRCPPTAALTERLRPDLVLVTGDMVAGQRAGLDYGAMWAGWHRAVTDPLRAAGIPMAVTPGNHDASGYAQYAAACEQGLHRVRVARGRGRVERSVQHRGRAYRADGAGPHPISAWSRAPSSTAASTAA